MKLNTKALSLAALTSISTTVQADDWDFQIEPYIMATTIDGDATVNRAPNTELSVNFDTILNNLESGAMLHFEAHHTSGWGMVFDYGYMDLGGTKKNDNGSRIKADVRQGVFEGLAVNRTEIANGHVDIIAGFRWWDNDLEASFNPGFTSGSISIEEKADWMDPVIGLRVQQKFAENWTFQAHLDVGGFGIGADFTSTVKTGVLYNINDLMTLDLNYKATWVDFDEGSKGQPGYFQYDTVTHGPSIGLIFNF
ncbi:hypothetical protein RGQ13_09190 [Thalassotalea psychrophila]|uniref:Outer membrane protein beta-barrel domain-containing protein n=1 Tax=Thalassotalea psychrophila TaxID=3065647 RepID=A0ABY9TZ76_9GAMM|nr:hypothetical protein RGQ13_09190 [Colwelliaceae bacterium SQ149]